MNSVGVDLHKKIIMIRVVSPTRQLRATQRFTCDQSADIVAWLQNHRPFQLTVEATASYEWFLQLVEPIADRIVLANPGRLRIIAETTRKTDKLDAGVLAELLALDLIPPAYRPTPRLRQHRTLVRHHDFLRRRQTAVKNRLRRLLMNYNADRDDLFTGRGRRVAETLPLSDADRFCWNQLWAQLELLHQQSLDLRRCLREFAAKAPIREAEARKLLRTIPGVGFLTAEVFLAEVGDIARFRSQKRVAAYAGLVPIVRESAGKRQDGCITHQGSRLLRWILCQAAWQLVRHSRHWQTIFEHLARRRGRRRAITAIARRLICVMTAVVARGQMYQPSGLPLRGRETLSAN